ncbi:hypothetical protein ABXN37_22850 [Piscinibacter sakaiensis]|uniref:Uncharacterized protein n=1 Tax=Piscinibacter sakaiensis TaxID=1547922 RepID=A0A0K8P610_PISS1|nr:hypothetical protein [Piscinibacter sakaiensis]GAP37964.1 hypothetical protein ISF6_4158 [Piscinibacter sakaiensis]
MPTPLAESRANANRIQSGQGTWPPPGPYLTGRLTRLPIYPLKYGPLCLVVQGLKAIVDGLGQPNEAQRTDHNDDLGNLPYAPHGSKHPVQEFHLKSNGLPHPNHPRLLWDTYRRMVFITPCHYDPWSDASGTERNPFYLIVGTPVPPIHY